MKKVLKNIIYILVLAAIAFYFRVQLQAMYSQLHNKFFPCSQPIMYSLGTFDAKFGISKTDFLNSVTQAEQIWEKPISKELFKYDPNGALKINLIYDIRQEATSKLNSMGITVSNNRASYDELKSKYTSLQTTYKQKKADLEAGVTQFEKEKSQYEAEVAAANKKGRVSQETIDQLNTERNSLNAKVDKLNQMQADLNSLVDEINSLASVLNRLAGELNIEVNQFNTIGSALPGEFEEGTYETGPDGQKINIYQFDDKAKLVRVLAHELGHALGLNHVNDPKAIMYRLNSGVNEKLTSTDLTELKNLCGVK